MSDIRWGAPRPHLRWWHRLLPKSRKPTPTHQVGTTVTTFEDSGVEMVRLKCYVRPMGGIYDSQNSADLEAGE